MNGFAALLGATWRSVARAFEERTRDSALTSAQWRLLVLLARHGPTYQARLADALEIEPISVSRMVDRLEDAGWVTREPHPDDRRARLVVPTARALDSLASLGDVAHTVYREATAGFTQAEIAALVDLMTRFNENLARAHANACRADDHATAPVPPSRTRHGKKEPASPSDTAAKETLR